jgi:MFS family permease
MLGSSCTSRGIRAAGVGAFAGVLASIVQVLIGWLLDRFFLPRGHDNNIAPRFVSRVFRRSGRRSNPVRDWALGTLFHLGYGLGWGTLFGTVRRWSRLPSWLVGSAAGVLIYLSAFSGIGVGTRTGTERNPERRPWQKQVSLVAVALAYVATLAWTFDRLERQDHA